VVVVALRSGLIGGVGGRPDQKTARSVFDPDPHRFHGKPGGNRRVGDEVRHRQDRVDQAGCGQQFGVAELRASQLLGRAGAVQPPEEAIELVIEPR
jgi:hypothetical protein